jgi:acetolactate synthase-1/2/3 large subunit
MNQLTGGQAVVQALVEEGVEVVFGLPGVQIMEVFDAFYGRSDIRLITVRHEQTTTFMADGYARVKGTPGVALVAPGPGVQNATAGLGTAFSASSPVLLLTGQIESHLIGRDTGALHEINDQLDIVRPITKWCHRVTAVAEIPTVVHEAIHQMRTGRPRPTEIEIPPDILEKTSELSFLEAETTRPPAPNGKQIAQAAALLTGAQKPFIWAGGGTIISNASQEIAALTEAVGGVVATTVEGKGIVPEDHPLSLGVGYYGYGAPAWAAPRADVVVAIGTRLTNQMNGATRLQSPQRLIHVDIDPTVIGKNYPAECAIVADARETLRALVREIRKKGRSGQKWSVEEIAGARHSNQKWLEEKAPLQSQIIARIGEELTDDAILISGTTNVGYWSHLAHQVRRPRTYLYSSYFGTLGFAFPVALGAKVAAPDRDVVCVAGDGGFMYALPELATAVQHGINVITIVFVDNAFGASHDDQRIRFNKRWIGTQLHNPSFAQTAELFGARGVRAEPEHLGSALREALQENRPTVIEVPFPTLTPPFYFSPPQL